MNIDGFAVSCSYLCFSDDFFILYMKFVTFILFFDFFAL